MDLDALEFLRRQRVGLRQDVLGHGHVADVVQQRRGPDALHLFVGQPGGLGQDAGIVLNLPDVFGRAAGARFDRERERLDRRELDVHRPARLVLLLAQPGHDGVIAAEHEVERHRQHGQPAEPAARRRRGGDRGERRAGQVAGRAPHEVALPDAHDRLARREGDRAGDERRVDEEVERRDHRRGAQSARRSSTDRRPSPPPAAVRRSTRSASGC